MSIDPGDSGTLSEEETEEILREVERRRTLRGAAVILVALLGVAFSTFQVWIAARGFTFGATLPIVGEVVIGSLQQLQINTIHVTFALLIAFLLFPPTRGDGFLARRLARIEPGAARLFGEDHPVTAVAARIRGFGRWLTVDRDLDRITPVDALFFLVSLLPVYYTVTEFDEIREIAVFGIHHGRPMHEVYPTLEPLVMAVAAVGIPLDEYAYAFVIGIIGIVLVLEATRRALGLLLTSLVALFIIYARWGYLIPRDSAIGALSISPTSWGDIVYNLWYTVEAGVFSTPVTVSVRFIYIFILFGAFLEMSGAGKWFIDLAYSLTGTRKGGPAKASTVASGFMGMLSGSSIANTVTTGAFTIPLMKRSGYSPEFSGAVESSASSGGQMLPPVMGAAAFLIVEFTGTPYAEVIIAATLPAIAFFFGMWVMVHFAAIRGDIGGLPRAELPNLPKHMRRGWFYLLPLALLLYFLIGLRLSINRAGWYTIVSVVALIAVIAAYNERTRLPLIGTIVALYLAQVFSYVTYGVGIGDALSVALGTADAGTPRTLEGAVTTTASDLAVIVIAVSLAFLLLRPRLETPLLELDDSVEKVAKRGAETVGRPGLAANPAYRFGTFVVKSMESGARTATTVVIAVAAAGVIPGVISITGLGPNLTSLILSVSGGSFIILLVLTGISAIIFGLGMPTTVMYIILVAMLGPALEEFGVAILAAHLFILYFGLMADVTPPVAVAAFAAAGIAKSDEFATAGIAFLLSLNKILVPFAFVFSPGILMIRVTDEGPRMVGTSDIAELGFFLPEVAVPVVGMFLGVYALGVTIIGYQYAKVYRRDRALFSIASILLMVPELALLIVEPLLALVGGPAVALTFAATFSLRIVGFVMLVALTLANRRRETATPAPGTPSTPSEE